MKRPSQTFRVRFWCAVNELARPAWHIIYRCPDWVYRLIKASPLPLPMQEEWRGSASYWWISADDRRKFGI